MRSSLSCRFVGRERKLGDCPLQSRTGPGHLMEESSQAALGPGGGEDGVFGTEEILVLMSCSQFTCWLAWR